MSIKSFIVIISFLAFIPRNDARLGGSIVDNLHDDSSTSIQKFSSHRYLTWFNDMVNSLGISSYNTIIDAKTLGATNFDAAVGNPLKGLLTSPRWVGRNIPDSVPSTLEFYYIGLDEIMTGWNQYDWTVLENTLRDAAARKTHVIWRIFCHYPGQRLRVPEFLIDAGIKLVSISDGGVSPQYDDPTLLRAFEQFIAALGERYDGHRSLAFLQLGLLGKWGEWHTYPDRNLISDSTKDKVVAWYSKAFTTTKMQIRNPRRSAYVSGVGLHDDSFAFSTLDGDANGGQNVGWFFWPKVKAAGETSFWRKGVMGGETRPEIQSSVFRPGYAAGTPFKQDFMRCVKTTHASYLLHNAAFQNGGYSGIELENALHAHTRMGYNFRVNRVEASKPQSQKVSIRVQVEQIGVAPFYYPLGLELSCQGYEGLSQGVDQLIDEGDSDWFIFHNIPATSECFDALEISLQSDLVYNERPVKFAQGVDGRVQFSLPPPRPAHHHAAQSGSHANVSTISHYGYTDRKPHGIPNCFSDVNSDRISGHYPAKGTSYLDVSTIGHSNKKPYWISHFHSDGISNGSTDHLLPNVFAFSVTNREPIVCPSQVCSHSSCPFFLLGDTPRVVPRQHA